MSESKDVVKRNEDTNKQKENKKEEEPSNTLSIIFRILLIIHMIIMFLMLVFFGLNHLILFTISMTLTIRMYLGVKNKSSNYFIKSLFLFNMCFVCHAIKIIFRFILTYFVYKTKEDISNLKDLNIIETNNILWIKGFDIKINGIWSIIIIVLFMVYWIVLIVLFELKVDCLKLSNDRDNEVYFSLINQFYQKLDNNQIQINEENNNIISNNINNNQPISENN